MIIIIFGSHKKPYCSEFRIYQSTVFIDSALSLPHFIRQQIPLFLFLQYFFFFLFLFLISHLIYLLLKKNISFLTGFRHSVETLRENSLCLTAAFLLAKI